MCIIEGDPVFLAAVADVLLPEFARSKIFPGVELGVGVGVNANTNANANANATEAAIHHKVQEYLAKWTAQCVIFHDRAFALKSAAVQQSSQEQVGGEEDLLLSTVREGLKLNKWIVSEMMNTVTAQELALVQNKVTNIRLALQRALQFSRASPPKLEREARLLLSKFAAMAELLPQVLPDNHRIRQAIVNIAATVTTNILLEAREGEALHSQQFGPQLEIERSAKSSRPVKRDLELHTAAEPRQTLPSIQEKLHLVRHVTLMADQGLLRPGNECHVSPTKTILSLAPSRSPFDIRKAEVSHVT
jgi:hypothetical protein